MNTMVYRGHDAQNPRRVFISGQKRGVFGTIKRERPRRSAIEPMKIDGHLGRCQRRRKRHTHHRRPQSSARSRLRALLRPILIALWQVFGAIPEFRWAS
jgi:IS5 family transposase